MQNSALMERRVRGNLLARCGVGEKLEMISKTYLSLWKEGSEIIQDNCQDTIFGGFAPNSQTADVLSRALGSYTVQSGSISRSKGENSQSLQMAERALMTPDELKSIPKGEFVVMKTGSHPMRTRLRLFLDWGITFGEAYQMPERGQRRVYYAGRPPSFKDSGQNRRSRKRTAPGKGGGPCGAGTVIRAKYLRQAIRW